MTDEIDLSTERALIANDAAIANQIAKQRAADARLPSSAPRNDDDEPVCIECGELIDAARIRALPRTVRCIDCAADAEHPNWSRRT